MSIRKMNSALYTIFFLYSFFGISVSFDVKFLISNRSVTALDYLIPSVHSSDERCRNHSLLYREELSKFTIWAVDMFDASTKFPSGIFSGSVYDTGNFDECVNVKLPKDVGFSGKHCMAHLRFKALKPISVKDGYSHDFDYYENIFNLTTWLKIANYAQDGSKQTRDEMFYSFCIPSSCTHKDLEESLRLNIQTIEDVLPVNLKVEVDKRNCQIGKNFILTRKEIFFLSILATFILICILSTTYHLVTERNSWKQSRFSGRIHDLLKAFSFSHSIKKMTSRVKSEEGMECMNGMKVISMFLVIMGHRAMFIISSPITNPEYVEKIYSKFQWIFLLNGPIIVDTFFTISGFLACYMILVELDKRNGMVNIGALYLHRFLRLTPAYAVVIGFYCTVFVQLGDGPFWSERIAVEQERCIASWWANLLYVNNYVNLDNICMFQSWYLTCDFHYFLIVPFITYMLWKNPRLGEFTLCTLISLAVLIPFVIIFINEEEPFLMLYMKFLRDPVMNHTFKTVYIPSHMRAASYLIGISAGYLKFKIRNSKFKLTSKLCYFGWFLGLTIVGGIFYSSFMFYIQTGNRNFILAGLYGSMQHLLWSISIAWCILTVSEGHVRFAAPILTWRPFSFLNRITYTSFLCHGAFQLYSVGIARTPLTVGLFLLTTLTASDIVLSYVAGFFLSLVFEAPIMAIEKIIFARRDEERFNEDGKTTKEFTNIGRNKFIDIFSTKQKEIG